MAILFINMIIVYITSILARYDLNKREFTYNEKNYNKFWVLISIISLALVSGFRENIGTDYFTYSKIFITSGNSDYKSFIKQSEYGFGILNKILYSISQDPKIFFLATSILINVLVVISLKKYSKLYELSMYLFITTFMYYTSMNIIRQWIATAILFWGYKYLVRRDFKQYFLLILLATSFHASSLIMVPVYFIVNVNIKSSVNCLLISIGLLFFLSYNYTIKYFFDIIGNTKYSNYIDEFSQSGQGVNPLRVLVYILILIIVFLNYKRINTNNSREININFNLCLIGTMIMILALKHKYFARLSVFFDPYILLIIPYIVTSFNKKENRILYFGVMIMYFLFSILLLLRGEGGINPYKWYLPELIF